jgi:hypothetical protein
MLALYVVFIGILLRVISWLYFARHKISFDGGVDPSLELAWDKHFIPYLIYFHTKPVGIPIRDYLLLRLLGDVQPGNFLITSLADSIAPGLVCLILLHLGVARWFSVGMASIWSLGLLGWDYWRGGAHFDHLNVCFVAFFIWALYHRLFLPRLRSDVFAGIAGGLLACFNSFAQLVVPCALLLSRPGPVWSSGYLKSCGISLLPIALVLGFNIGKNWIEHGVPATSTVGGQNALQFVSTTPVGKNALQFFTFYDLTKINQVVEAGDYPLWWRWCYEEGVERGGDDTSRLVNAVYGQCFTGPDGKVDFGPLESRLEELGEDRLVAIVRRDQMTADTRPWLWLGGYTGSNSRFSIEYGRISGSVWGDYLIERPMEFLWSLYYAHHAYLHGLGFLGSMRYEPQHRPRPVVARIAGYIVVSVMTVGVMASYGICLGWLGYLSSARIRDRLSSIDSDECRFIVLLSFLFVVASTSTNMLTCCENDRMFVSWSPLVLVVGGYVGARGAAWAALSRRV